MKKVQNSVVLLILVMLLVVACAPGVAPAPAPVPASPAPAPQAPAASTSKATQGVAIPAWQAEWEKTLAEARKEGRVVVSTATGGQVVTDLTAGLKAATGLSLETISERSVTFTPRILAERRAGLYLWDIILSGSGSLVDRFKPNGLVDRLDPEFILLELTDSELVKKTWLEARLPFIDGDHSMLMGLLSASSPIAINTDLVKPGEIKSYRDVLNPKWKGKVVLNDPAQGGYPGFTFMPMIVIGGVAGGEQWLRDLAKIEPILLRDARLEMDWLAHGKVAIVIAPDSDMLESFIKVGAPVKGVQPEEGTVLQGGASGVVAVNKRPRPNAARLFINWYLSKEGLTVMSKAYNGHSTRLDVPTDHLPPERIRMPGGKYYIKDLEQNLMRQAEVTKIVKEIFDPLRK